MVTWSTRSDLVEGPADDRVHSWRLDYSGTTELRGQTNGAMVLIVVQRGGLLIGDEAKLLVPESHGVLLQNQTHLQIATSDQHNQVVLWSLSADAFGAICHNGPRGVRPLRQAFPHLVPSEGSEHCLGRVMIVLGITLLQEPVYDLAQHVDIEDEGTREVVRLIRSHQRPTLREAADMAGYSHFHFSRRFRDVTGYGFHEYLDRVRASWAIAHAPESKSLVRLAESAGFSNVKTMRESIFDYTGFQLSQLVPPKR